MHTKVRAFFDEHAAPGHCDKRAVHDQLSPIVRMAAKAQQQVLEYRTLITEATLAADHDPAFNGKLEMMHQTFGAMERSAAALSLAARDLARDTAQLDRYVAEWRDDFDRLAKAVP